MPRTLLNKWFHPHHSRHRCYYCQHEYLLKGVEIPEYRVSHFDRSEPKTRERSAA